MENRYAVMKSGENIVKNVILAEQNYVLPGFTLHKLTDGQFCEPQMYFNESDGVFYQDESFTMTYPSHQSESD